MLENQKWKSVRRDDSQKVGNETKFISTMKLVAIAALLVLLQPGVSSKLQIVTVRNFDVLTDKLNILIDLQRNNSILLIEKRDVMATLLRQQNYQDNHMMAGIDKLAEEVTAIRKMVDLMSVSPQRMETTELASTSTIPTETTTVAEAPTQVADSNWTAATISLLESKIGNETSSYTAMP